MPALPARNESLSRVRVHVKNDHLKEATLAREAAHAALLRAMHLWAARPSSSALVLR
jgi:hypothetical protein